MLIASIDPAEFRTQAIEIEPFAGGINITPVGIPVDFETMQMRRKACQPSIPGKYANLGVSAQIHLTLFEKEYLILVRQQKADHALLKLPSGYVPLEQLSNPYLTLAQELVEECLLLKGKKFCRVELNTQRLIKPYSELEYHSEDIFQLYSERSNPLKFPQAQIYINRQPLLGNPFLYIHKQTCSAQLVYPLRMKLPDCEELSLLHAEEQYDQVSNELNVILNSELWLARVNGDGIFSLNKLIRDRVQAMKIPADTRLSEVFAPKRKTFM
ncbi:hypothetical protein [Amphritea sp.]|uniref:hypothetical protein n=1 Tax=Amphritea sp. TaxID=1872502 RepID=UPI0025C3BB14|nr:hypothetical protein [Amphritea sp.]